MPSIQNRKQPRIPVTPWSSTWVIQPAIMNRPTASALCARGSMPSGRNQNATVQDASNASRPAVRRSEDAEVGAAAPGRTGASIDNGLTMRPTRCRVHRSDLRDPYGCVDEPPVAHAVHRRKDFHGLRVVADHDDRLTMIDGERFQEIRDRGSVRGVEVAGRLVGKD